MMSGSGATTGSTPGLGLGTGSARFSLSANEFLLFQDYIMDNCGIIIPLEKSYLFETRLSALVRETGVKSFYEFYKILVSHSNVSVSLQQRVIDAMTTNETLWFRDSVPWEYLEEVALPQLVGELLAGKRKKVRIWSAAVSTGQEIYSTVMCVDEYLKKNCVKGVDLSNFEFFATDICSRVIEIAKKGSYEKNSMERGLSSYFKTKYFAQNGSFWDIDPNIRCSVKFLKFNLINDYRRFGAFDIIFCRYVLIYFSDNMKKSIIDKMSGSLVSGGLLFTGNYVLYDMFDENYIVKRYKNISYYIKNNLPFRDF